MGKQYLKQGKINTVIDLSWGSSSKGLTSAWLAIQEAPDVLVSTNRSNSSHTLVYEGEEFVFKILPTSAGICRYLKNYEPHVFIGATASFAIDQLIKEIEWCGLPKDRVIIHPRAMVNQQKHSDAEAGVTLHLGSTMSGAGAVYAEKVMRGQDVELAFHFKEQLDEYATIFEDEDAFMFTSVLSTLLDGGCTALAELSQGFPLSIDHSLNYMYSTSRNVVPAQILSDLGLRPDYQGNVVCNIRSYPIRVSNRFDIDKLTLLVDDPKNPTQQINMTANELGIDYNRANALIEDLWIKGNTRTIKTENYGEVVAHCIVSGVDGFSGACEEDMTEIDWEQMSEMAGMDDPAYYELTTLTKLTRRIFKVDDGSISKDLLRKFKIACDAEPIIAVTFLNYVDWECNDIKSKDQMTQKAKNWINQANEDLEEVFGSSVQVDIVQFGRDIDNQFEL